MSNICSLCKQPLNISEIKSHNLACQSCRVIKSELVNNHGYTNDEAEERLSYGRSIDGKTRYWGIILNRKQKDSPNG